jgi:hypothetical protein
VLSLLCAVLAVGAVSMRHLVAVGSGQARPALFYIREATVPVDPADQLLAESADRVGQEVRS